MRLLFAATTLALALVAAPARAESPTAVEPSWFVREGMRPKVTALEINPLGVLIGRFGANAEYMAAPHHAIVVSAHYLFAFPGVADQIDGAGAEAGYRYYTRADGMFGWFLGAGLTFASYRYRHFADVVRRASDQMILDGPVDNTWQSFGAAIDAGWQMLLQEHLVLGAGVGVEYRYFVGAPGFEYVSHPRHDLVFGEGLRPRMLLAAGGAF